MEGGVAKVFVINLERRPDRLHTHLASFKWKAPVARVDAVDNREDPELGCFHSHVRAWCAAACDKSLGPGDPWVVVAEDDAVPSAAVASCGPEEALRHIASDLDKKKIDWIQLYVPEGCAAGVRALRYRAPAFSALCVMARVSALRALARCALADLRSAGDRFFLPLDAWLIWCFCRRRPRIRWASCPLQIVKPGSPSDIEYRRRTWWRPAGSFYEDYCAAILHHLLDPPSALPVFHRLMIAFSTRSSAGISSSFA